MNELHKQPISHSHTACLSVQQLAGAPNRFIQSNYLLDWLFLGTRSTKEPCVNGLILMLSAYHLNKTFASWKAGTAPTSRALHPCLFMQSADSAALD